MKPHKGASGPPACRLCGVAEWRHVCAGGATKRPINKPAPAINRPVSPINRRAAAINSHGKDRSPNGRPKPAYNAYMRLYMQARRAITKGLACEWPARAATR